MIILIDSFFWWDADLITSEVPWEHNVGYRKRTYLSLKTIDDLVDQFNYVGFNDLCIYPPNSDMARYNDPGSTDTKGIEAVYYGHTYQNQTGK